MIITVANQKGGVGKTTTTVALAVHLRRTYDLDVLVVDVDPQANATTAFGGRDVKPNMFDVFEGTPTEDVIQVDTASGVHILPGHISLAHLEHVLASRMDRERILVEALNPLRPLYDVILIDSPPSLGVFAYNALAAADTIIAPMQCEPFATDGLALLYETLAEVAKTVNPKCQLGGVALTMYDPRRNVDKRVVASARAVLEDDVFNTVIPRDVRMAEAMEDGNIDVFTGASSAARAYAGLTEEVFNKWLQKRFDLAERQKVGLRVRGEQHQTKARAGN